MATVVATEKRRKVTTTEREHIKRIGHELQDEYVRGNKLEFVRRCMQRFVEEGGRDISEATFNRLIRIDTPKPGRVDEAISKNVVSLLQKALALLQAAMKDSLTHDLTLDTTLPYQHSRDSSPVPNTC